MLFRLSCACAAAHRLSQENLKKDGMWMRRWIFLLLAALLLAPGVRAVSAAPEEAFDLSADAAVLMEPETGTMT